MAGPVTGTNPTPINWQLSPQTPVNGAKQGPADTSTSQPLNLELPQKAIILPPQDFSNTNNSLTNRFNFERADVQFNQPKGPVDKPMTRGEFVDQVRDGLHDSLGDGAATGVETLAGAAYLATGGKVKVSRETQLFNQPAQIDFTASARHGGTVGIGFKMKLGGR